MEVSDISDLAQGVMAGERRALARAITMIESERSDHRIRAEALLAALPRERQALRIGFSGAPGVGKSSFIESFGLHLCEQGLRVAVLAVDPSSARSGGSILGDKTRMDRLSRCAGAYIRPSPSQSRLGGVARRSREAVSLCEAAGFDVVLIETVGVGQSETHVAGLCDIFVLMLAPAAGDELQGVKRGIMEAADLVLVNKADGELHAAAVQSCSDYSGALRLLRRRPRDAPGFPMALTVSAHTGAGVSEAWTRIGALAAWRQEAGHFATLRAAQARMWFEEEVRHRVLSRLTDDPAMRSRLSGLGDQVERGDLAPDEAVAAMLDALQA